jgi:hypothetical protein
MGGQVSLLHMLLALASVVLLATILYSLRFEISLSMTYVTCVKWNLH